MTDELEEKAQESMDKAIEALGNELKKVRTGRAQVSMLDSIKVDYYGSSTPLNQVASVSCPDAKSFLISPWESNILKNIEAAIVKSNIGMSPQNDGKAIRLKLPELTEERRKDLVKTIKKVVEEARVSIRMARREANEILKKALKNKEISEDDKQRISDSIQKLTDTFTKKVESMSSEKERDLMTL